MYSFARRFGQSLLGENYALGTTRLCLTPLFPQNSEDKSLGMQRYHLKKNRYNTDSWI